MNGSTYIAHKEGDELAHYGVKGQKWDVRKDIRQGRRAVKLRSFLRFALVGPMGKAGSEITDDGHIDLQMKKRKSNEGG